MVITRRHRYQGKNPEKASLKTPKAANDDYSDISVETESVNEPSKKRSSRSGNKKRNKKDAKGSLSDDIQEDTAEPRTASDDEDSDAPVEMGFNETKSDAFTKFRLEKELIEAERVKKKKQKQVQQERFIEQKQQKQKLDSLRLPSSVLDALDESFEPNANPTLKPDEEVFKLKDRPKVKRNFNEKYFSHGSTEFTVYNINEELRKPYDAAEEAASFRNRMVNRKNVCREPVSKMNSVAKKQRTVGLDKFVIG